MLFKFKELKIMNLPLNFIYKKKLFLFILGINIIFLLATLSNTYTDGYNLRQAQTAILTRNIFYDNFSIFPTRLTFFAPLEGNIIFEFPFIHFLTSLTYKIFPISEINGRFINLIFYIFNGILFYKIQKLIFRNDVAAITSSLFISSPLILYLAHAYMPETTTMTFYLLSYYFFIKNKVNKSKINATLMFISLAIAPLLKPPAGILFLPIFLDSLDKINYKTIIKKSIPFLISTLPLFIWMFYAKLINSSEYSTGADWNWINILLGKGSLIKSWIDFDFYKNIISYFLIQHLNPLTFAFSIYAIIINIKSKDHITRFHINWILANILFLFVFADANKGHPYYQIFFTPNLIFFIGMGLIKLEELSKYKNIISNILVSLNLILSISVFIYGSNDQLRISNIGEFKSVINEKIVIDKKNPSEYILFANQGLASSAVFTYYSDSYSNIFSVKHENLSDLKEEINLGAKYIFFLKTSYGNSIESLKRNNEIYNWLNTSKTKLYESKNMILYKLK